MKFFEILKIRKIFEKIENRFSIENFRENLEIFDLKKKSIFDQLFKKICRIDFQKIWFLKKLSISSAKRSRSH